MKKRNKKTEFSFNDLSFRIPGIVILTFCIIAEFTIILLGRSSQVHLTENISFPGFLALGVVGLIMFIIPYILMGYDIYKKEKETKNWIDKQNSKGE
ncbi:hypothetical protein [Leptospira bandrabouensis]|uniref:Uncharacterized protein n=1 Tax=Leptospira bandrabouensis TaxID=2484903 RepID=A0A6H3NS42_9LEPT|nr:hypothetical protein [Leptospira bandrabouensis]TGN07443.1 hypothetical protein EHR07_04795 [Leptospira bandrabouensis]TGN12812.1 hypothetical protein EHR08_15810 [Leptospira bandrabouensis]